MNRRIIIILSVVLLITFGLFIIIFMNSKQGQDSKQEQTFDNNRVPTRPANEITRSIDESSEQPPEEIIQAEENFYRVNVPDVFVANLTPFENESFSIRSDLVDDGANGQFVFYVEPKTDTLLEAQTALEQWLLENQLTNDQISRLTITFE